jgi:hypothetical protein
MSDRQQLRALTPGPRRWKAVGETESTNARSMEAAQQRPLSAPGWRRPDLVAGRGLPGVLTMTRFAREKSAHRGAG